MKHFTLKLDDHKLIKKVESMANKLQVSPDELISRIIKRYTDSLEVASST